MDPGSIHSRVLKELKCKNCWSDKKFVTSFKSASMPEDWKVANVSWIFKTVSSRDSGNFRLVSLTCLLGKLVESTIKYKTIKLIGQQVLLEKKILQTYLTFSNLIQEWWLGLCCALRGSLAGRKSQDKGIHDPHSSPCPEVSPSLLKWVNSKLLYSLGKSMLPELDKKRGGFDMSSAVAANPLPLSMLTSHCSCPP